MADTQKLVFMVLHDNSRGITAADLIDGTEVVAAGRFIAEITSATNSLVY